MKEYKFVPLRDFIQFEPEKPGEVVTSGGIALPETATDRSFGTVVAAGPGVSDERIGPGSRIVYSELQTMVFPLSLESGRLAFYVPEDGVHAILTEEEDDVDG